jgi:uncharacterized protein (TIGR02147 family)
MVNVFDYTDFRKYLAEYYEEKKRNNPRFSYQIIADKAGIKSKGFIYNIINGEKVLSKSNIFKLSKALDHNQYEADYFENCVAFSQSDDLLERKTLLEKLNKAKNIRKEPSKTQLLRKDQYEFISNWYHAVVRSIIGMYGFKGDYGLLAKMVNPPITATQAKHSVRLLEKLGLINRGENGDYTLSEAGLTTGKDVMSIAFQNFHIACIDLAKRAIAVFPVNKRNITGLTLGISEKSYDRICDEIQMFQSKIMEIANADKEANRVYQLNFHLFPTSDLSPESENL